MKKNIISVITPRIRVYLGDVKKNREEITKAVEKYYGKYSFIIFPELSLTGYTCGDLFHNTEFLSDVDKESKELIYDIQGLGYGTKKQSVVIVGLPYKVRSGKLYNGALIISHSHTWYIPKTYLPEYGEFYEKRWFSPGHSNNNIFECGGVKFGVEICEDLWAPCPPSNMLALRGADIIFNLSASNGLVGKQEYRKKLVEQQSARLICSYVYCNSGYGESTQDMVWGDEENLAYMNGVSLGNPESGILIDLDLCRHDRIHNSTFRDSITAEGEIISIEDDLVKPGDQDIKKQLYHGPTSNPSEIFKLQVLGLMRRLDVTGAKPVIGVSGGSDSTLALLVCVEAMKKLGRDVKDVIGVSMPGFATSKRTRTNASLLMNSLGVRAEEIDICEMCNAEFKALGHPGISQQDITFENVQARTRTELLMNIANKEGGLVIGTGDMSELALGWCTYNADHMSMYNVNGGLFKSFVKSVIKWYGDENPGIIKDTLTDILQTPVSPELKGTGAGGDNPQVTEDNIGSYDLIDFYLYYFLRFGFGYEGLKFAVYHSNLSDQYSEEEMIKTLDSFWKRFRTQQFKRSCMPDCPKIGSVSLSPRGDWRMPSDMEKI